MNNKNEITYHVDCTSCFGTGVDSPVLPYDDTLYLGVHACTACLGTGLAQFAERNPDLVESR
jgi:hypothetical protein